MSFKIVAGIILCLAAVNLTLFFSHFQWAKKITAAIAVAVVFASAVSGIAMQKINFMQSATPISIRALDQKHIDAGGTEIWIVGVEVDDVFYEPDKLFPSGWMQKDGKIGWQGYDQPVDLTTEITGKLPIGQERRLILEANKWRGITEIMVDDVSQRTDCYLPQEQSESLEVSLPPAVATEALSPKNMHYLIFGILFFVVIAGILFLLNIQQEKKMPDITVSKDTARNREIWSDLLRVVSCFAIVVIHATGILYAQYEPSQRWYFALYINAITRFAVPCFMMLSGAYTIAHPQFIKTLWEKRLSRVVIPLLVWSVCYIFLRATVLEEEISIIRQIAMIPLQHQSGHLWFIYQLIGFYLLLPILSQLYQALSVRYRWYFVSITLLVPSLLDYLFGILMPDAPEFLSIKWSHIGIAEIGLFFFGCILLDYLKKKPIASQWAALTAFVGFSGIVVGNYVVSIERGQSFWKFFDQVRFPTVIFAAGVFALFYSMEKHLHKLPEQMKLAVRKMSQLSMGVYFVHCIPLALISGGTTKKILVSFVVSYAFCYLVAQIPYLKKLVL